MNDLLNVFIDPLKLAGQSIILVMTYTILFLVLEAFIPKFKKWADTLFIIVLILTLGQTVMDSFSLMGQLVNVASDFFLGVTPILTSLLVVLNSVFSFIAWSPVILFIFEMLMLLCKNILIPAVTVALVLDFCTRFIQDISFSKASDLIRGSVMTMITALLIAMVTVLSFTGVAFFTIDQAIASPAKKVIEQTIPIVGSLIVEGFSIFQKYQSTATTVAGFSAMTAFWIAAFFPAGKLLIHALTFKFLAAIVEPFTGGTISGLLDDVGKSLLLLCAVAILLGIAFVFIWLILMVIMQLGVGKSF
ncbi:stage III sporulation protein AE [Lysinibacillus endophyticus]|uniref:Stage III sporulation protein AE n=1 Tax=Ureibacillus endophyticus TaxID=1978490 RepID=A0A494Z0A8_9BACL|nr:stage III sporulation protein AE [Lysinibacillus endophyticus]MCP1145198.1 stage III sporulation protein AE [Lysinibacillus endophyticus]RKQ15789.1 stage III sporulation protein AE [Lysinibacillus endophyticus]